MMHWRRVLLIWGFLFTVIAAPGRAQMVTGADMPGYASVFSLSPAQQAKSYSVVQIASSLGANILWPGETVTLTFQVTNRTAQPLRMTGHIEIISYGTHVPPGDIWTPHVHRIGGVSFASAPVMVSLPPNGSAPVTVTPSIPARFGGYALIFNMGPQGRAFGAAVTRTVAADPGKVRLPTFALDLPWPFEMSEAVMQTFRRLGTKAARMGGSYTPTTSPNYERDLAELTQHLKWAEENDISVMLTLGAGSAPQPLGRGRPWLNADNSMKENVKEDLAWLPEYDPDFQKWVARVTGRFGWPRGPVNAVELWNEPWEGVSISGWGADLPRYREMYEHMAKGVQEARRDAGVQVLIGGASSSSNTLDKLFPDGDNKFLPWLDFVSIHYQEMAAVPSLVPEWINRKSAYGRVQVWDTESWVANSEDRVAAVIASMRAQGQDRTVGIYHRNVYDPQKHTVDGKEYAVAQAWAPAAAVAASQKFIGQRAFKELLFKNGLPWVFAFDGLKNADDGTIVIVGDLGGVYNRNKLLFRSVLGLKNAPQVAALEKRLAALPADAPEAERKKLDEQLKAAQVLDGATLTIPNGGGQFQLFDFYGNPVAAKNGRIVVPLNGLGYFLRTNGAKGSFAKLAQAVRGARIEGYEPVEIIAHDFTAPLKASSSLRLTVTNVLNRPVSGTLVVQYSGTAAAAAGPKPLRLRPQETREVRVPFDSRILSRTSNTCRVHVTFDAGKDGAATHEEDVHVNLISRRQIVVDGKLDDWRGVLPQPVSGAGLHASLTEQAWLPFKNFEAGTGKGIASGYLAYDANHFYFAAKIADDTPYAGNVRFETRDDDRYYYPEKVTDKGQERVWPAGVRRFSYRQDPDLPSGSGTDNVQIAFNVIPLEKEPWRSHPKGTMPRFMAYRDTDYEYALNAVAPEHGGGTEIWRMFAPGMPRKHFYPRQPKSKWDGPVKNGQLAMRREGSTRIVEAALPWSEMPDVKKRLDAGQTIKFSFRVNDNDGPAYEMAAGRSVSKDNFLAFHNDWMTHWANEVEFGWER